MNQKIQTTNESLQLQRLIDGECSSEDIREILTAARNQPWQWEQIALALLEDRAWQQKLHTIADQTGNADTLSELKKLTIDIDPKILAGQSKSLTSLTESREPVSAQLNSSLAPTREMPGGAVRPLTPSSDRSRTRWNWLALAASLLTVAAIGYSSGQFFADRNSSRSLAQNHSDSFQPISPSEFDSATANPKVTPISFPEYRMQLPGNDRHRLQGEVPLYRVESMDQWVRIGDKIPEGFQLNSQQIESLNSQGIGIEHDVDFLSGSLGEGRVFIVPIRSVRLSPTQ